MDEKRKIRCKLISEAVLNPLGWTMPKKFGIRFLILLEQGLFELYEYKNRRIDE